MSQSGESEGEQISPLDYARQNGIALNYLGDLMPYSHLNSLQEDIIKDFTENEALPQFDFGPEHKTEERLEVSREGALLLASISHINLDDNFKYTQVPLLSSRSAKRLKLEQPLLETDHELDCKQFCQRDDFEVKLKDVKLPLEMVDEENGEGLGFPAKYWAYDAEKLQEMQKEKLTVKRDTLLYLQECIKTTWTTAQTNELWQSLQSYKKRRTLEYVSPPLSPIQSPSRSDIGFSPSAYNVPLLSNPPSLLGEDLQAIEDGIFKQDCPTPIDETTQGRDSTHNSSDAYPGGGIRLEDIFPPLKSSPPSAAISRFHRADYKVEGPLTPLKSEDNTAELTKHILEQVNLKPGSPVLMEGLESKFFDEAFGSPYARATHHSEHEKLVVADAIARVNVPDLRPLKSIPPWDVLSAVRDAVSVRVLQQEFLASLTKELRFSGEKLANILRGHTDLRWSLFSQNLEKVALDDSTVPEGGEYFINGLINNDVIDSSDLTWKPPGLRILRDDDEDEEIEHAQFGKATPQDLMVLVKKRKLSLNESKTGMQVAKRLIDANNSNIAGLSRQRVQQDTAPAETRPEFSISSWLDGDFSARKEIDKLFEMRGIKKPKLLESADPQAAEAGQTQPARNKENETLQLPIRKSPLSRATPLPVPSIIIPSNPIYVIVSSEMFLRRGFIRALERTMPSLNLIERNFSVHNKTTWQRGSVSRSPVKSPLDTEADLIVSPSLGIIITTLQKIKQKPLPGDKAITEIRDRVKKSSLRYERLAILVSAIDDTSSLETNDCMAFAEFVGFTAGLDCNIIVNFIGAGDEALSKWIMSLITQNAVPEELLTEETHWELFLRRAGMNTYAAQCLIACLNAPPGVNMMSPSKAGMYGLSCFVEMAEQERVNRFKHICGEKLLKRISAVIDASWSL